MYPVPYTLYPEKGLTLIEILLAVSILGIGIVGVLRGYARSITTLEAGQLTLDATALAKQKMAEIEEEIREADQFPQNGEAGPFEEPYEDFAWDWTIEPVDPELEGLHKLTLVISNDIDPRTFSLRTYMLDKKSEEDDGGEE